MKRQSRLTRLIAGALCTLGLGLTFLQGCGGSRGSGAEGGKARYVPLSAESQICDTIEPTEAQKAEVEAALKTAGKNRAGGKTTITVYFHIITTDAGAGDVSDANLITQISVMNTAFAGGQAPGGFNTSYRFQLAGIDRTANTAWYNAGINTPDEIAMKTALRKGSADDLNVYVKLSDVGGYSTFPWGYTAKPLEDGIVVTSPGSGDGLVHEAGHWLGLYHTFQGGCDANNDYVSDTPAEQNANRACPAPSLDTCKGSGFNGKDPTMNFMDYTPDACKYQFTSAQNTRRELMWNAWRAGK